MPQFVIFDGTLCVLGGGARYVPRSIPNMSGIRDKIRDAVLVGVVGLCSTAAASSRDLSRDDVAWLNRVTYGISAASVAQYRDEGRRRFLQEQLDGKAKLPAPVAQQIQAL